MAGGAANAAARVLPVQAVQIGPGGVAVGLRCLERSALQRSAEFAPLGREEIARSGVQQRACRRQPAALQLRQPFGCVLGARRRALQGIDQRPGIGNGPVVRVDLAKARETCLGRLRVLAGERPDDIVGCRRLLGVQKQVELRTACCGQELGVQKLVQAAVAGGAQFRAGVVVDAVQRDGLCLQLQPTRTVLHPLHELPRRTGACHQRIVQGFLLAAQPRPVVVVVQPVGRQQQLQRRTRAVLGEQLRHHGLRFGERRHAMSFLQGPICCAAFGTATIRRGVVKGDDTNFRLARGLSFGARRSRRSASH